MKTVYLICGVSGSGKSWACRQLTDKFKYIPHDEYYDKVIGVIRDMEDDGKPIITECPFGERLMKEQLESFGIKVIPYFVVEPPNVVRQRYFEREQKPIPQAALTRATTIMKRVHEWRAPHGNSDQVLEMLKTV